MFHFLASRNLQCGRCSLLLTPPPPSRLFIRWWSNLCVRLLAPNARLSGHQWRMTQSPGPPTQNREIHRLETQLRCNGATNPDSPITAHQNNTGSMAGQPCGSCGCELSMLQGLAMKLSSALLSMSVSSSLSLEACQDSDPSSTRSFNAKVWKNSSLFPPRLLETDQFSLSDPTHALRISPEGNGTNQKKLWANRIHLLKAILRCWSHNHRKPSLSGSVCVCLMMKEKFVLGAGRADQEVRIHSWSPFEPDQSTNQALLSVWYLIHFKFGD